MKAPRCLVAILTLQGFAASLAADSTARAEVSHGTVTIDLDDCEEALAAEVRRIVAVELRATIADSAHAGSPATRIVATCHGPAVDLWLADASTAKSLERTMALSEAAPSGHARLLALAIAELVVASWHEIESGPLPIEKPVVLDQAPPTAIRAIAGTTSRLTSAVAEIVGTTRTFPGSGLWLVGGGARGWLTLSQPFTLGIEVTAEWGTATRATGQVGARAMGGALSLGWKVERPWALIVPWAGVRGGSARLNGEPSPGTTSTSGESQSGSFLGPEVGAMVALFPRAALHATIALSAGAALLGVQGEVVGDRNVNVFGPWVGLAIGVGLAR